MITFLFLQVIAIFFLWQTTGPASMAGIAVLVILAPVNGGILVSVYTKYQVGFWSTFFETRMHSSRMRTGRSLAVFRGVVPGPGGSWSRGVVPGRGGLLVGGLGFLVQGGYWSGGCLVLGGVPGPGRDGAWSGGGGFLVRGVYLVCGGSVRYIPWDQTRYPSTPPPGPDQVPPVNRITDRCKNITLAQLRCGRW